MCSQRVALSRSFLRWLTLLALIGAVGGCAVRRCPAPPRREVRSGPYPVIYAGIPPRIDGVLDDETWKHAVPHKIFYEFKQYGKRVDIATAYLAWDKDNLYFAIDVKDKDLFALEKRDDKELCTADVSELFVKPSAGHLDLYEFEFNFLGALWYIHYISRGGRDPMQFTVTDHAGLTVRATYRGTPNDWSDVDDGYTIEAAIPLKLFERAAPGGPKPGDRWKFNVCGADVSCYREDVLSYTTCDGCMKKFWEYEIYPEMVFLAPGEQPDRKIAW